VFVANIGNLCPTPVASAIDGTPAGKYNRSYGSRPKTREKQVSPKRPKPLVATKTPSAPAKPKKQKKTSRGK
jgi:hypothetical protein